MRHLKEIHNEELLEDLVVDRILSKFSKAGSSEIEIESEDIVIEDYDDELFSNNISIDSDHFEDSNVNNNDIPIDRIVDPDDTIESNANKGFESLVEDNESENSEVETDIKTMKCKECGKQFRLERYLDAHTKNIVSDT